MASQSPIITLLMLFLDTGGLEDLIGCDLAYALLGNIGLNEWQWSLCVFSNFLPASTLPRSCLGHLCLAPGG